MRCKQTFWIYLALISVIFLFSFWPGRVHAGSGSPVLDANTAQPNQHELFTVQAIADVENMYAFEAIFEYDPSVIRFVRGTSSVAGFTVQAAATGNKITFAHTQVGDVPSITGRTELVQLTFETLLTGKSDIRWKSLTVVSPELGKAVQSPEVLTSIQVLPVAVEEDDNGGSETEAPPSPNQAISTRTFVLPSEAVRINTDPNGRISGTLDKDRTLLDINRMTEDVTAIVWEVPVPDSGSLQAASVSLAIPSEIVAAVRMRLPGAAQIIVESSIGSYSLPVHLLKLDEGKQAVVTIEQAGREKRNKVESKVLERGAALAGNPVDFSVAIVSADGTVTAVNHFGKAYVTSSLPAGAIKPEQSAAVWVKEDGSLVPVPVRFLQQEDGTYTAMIKRMGNGTYAIVTGDYSFDDLEGHWAKEDLLQMAARWMVNGRSEESFVPDEPVTRAEIAALLVQAMGLDDESGATVFSDVERKEWFYPAVTTAAAAGLIEGYEDGMFKPDQYVTREEVAVLLRRAMQLTGAEFSLSTDAGGLTDLTNISSWSSDSVTQMIQAGIMQGDHNKQIRPKAQTSRAESAVMLKRLLQAAGFI